MDVFVIGDLIIDRYIFGESERICPEAPVPVIIPKTERESKGGAGLVRDQLQALGISTAFTCGSISTKRRYFVGNHLVCRVDYDNENQPDTLILGRTIVSFLKEVKPKLLIVSDYGKGSFSESSAKRIMQAASILDIPVFVDAKHNWTWWDGAYAKFPNQRETHNVGTASYIIAKKGSEGCVVCPNKKAKIPVPLDRIHEVKDVTGAGDIFLAAFATYWIGTSKDMVECAKYANSIASVSVEHLGTYVVGS